MQPGLDVSSASFVDAALDSRAVSFENPTGERGRGGAEAHGRKGAPNRRIAAGERVVLGDLTGPGTIRHIWMTFPPAPPEVMRALSMEVFYNGATEPSVSVPCLDFFGVPHGRPVAYDSVLTSVHEGRGYNAYFPMPFAEQVRVELTNSSAHAVLLYYQIDYTLEPAIDERAGYLHASFRRQNPTTMGTDFVIAGGWDGPGRFLGCNVGVRVLDTGDWYGEGEVKVYRDGDRDLPTICGTGLEDYVGSAWGLGPHAGLYAGAPLVVRADTPGSSPDFVGFYRWHLPDPVMFASDLRVTIQQIGAAFFARGKEREFDAYSAAHPAAGEGWHVDISRRLYAWGLAERVDDYCATAYVYCTIPQPVPRVDMAGALADIGRRPYETPDPFESFGVLTDAPG